MNITKFLLVTIFISAGATVSAQNKPAVKDPVKSLSKTTVKKKPAVRRTAAPQPAAVIPAARLVTLPAALKDSAANLMTQGTSPVSPAPEKAAASGSHTGQDYKTAVGIRLFWGIAFTTKHFLSQAHAVEAIFKLKSYKEVGTDLSLTALYQFTRPVRQFEGLRWYAGGGLYAGYFSFKNQISSYVKSAGYNDNEFYMGVSGVAGIEYKFKNLPLAISGDWQPQFNIIDSYGVSGFDAASGGLGLKYTF